MSGEKYIVVALDNPAHIAVRNVLNPLGYMFLGNCSDATSMIRMIRSYNPDFAIVDVGVRISDYGSTLETIDEEMLCACIIIGDRKDELVSSLLNTSNAIAFCPKPLNRDVFGNIVDMAMLGFKRVNKLSSQLREMTENYETRKSVERAKWILMKRDGMSEKEAYERMRKKSMDNRMALKDIADAIIFTYDITQ